MLNACAQSTSTSPTASPSTNAATNAAKNLDRSSASGKMSLGITEWIGYTPLYIAVEKGFFKELGLDFSLVSFGSNLEMRAAFLGGKVDGQANVASEAVMDAHAGKDFKIVLVADNSQGGDGILARKKITDLQAFKGQTIAVELGGVSHFFLLQVLKEVGLSSRDVKLINASPDAAAAAYGAGKVDIAVTYAPYLSQANATQPDGRIIYDTSKMPTAIIDIYSFGSQFVATYPKAVRAFIQGVFKGIDYLRTNPPEALAIAAKQFKITPKELEKQLKGVKLEDLSTNKEMLGNPNSQLYLLNLLNELGSFLKDQGQIKTVPDMSKYIDPSFVNTLP
jgi:NitT/TauT family transport system substrate-binding protein